MKLSVRRVLDKVKVSVPWGYTFFILGVISVIALTNFKVTCPACTGTGYITVNEEVTTQKVEADLVESKFFDYCGDVFSQYVYSVRITLKNETTDPWYGPQVIEFYKAGTVEIRDYASAIEGAEGDVGSVMTQVIGGKIAIFRDLPLAKQAVFVEVPAKTEKTVEQIVRIEGLGMEDFAKNPPILWTVSTGSIGCPYCNLTGKVLVTEWLRLKIGLGIK